MNILSLISNFLTSATYTVTRTAVGSTVRGRIEAGTQTTVTIIGSVSPATGRDLERLPEGRQAGEARTIFTTTQLYVGGQGDAYEADQIAIDGSLWEIFHVEAWLDSQSRATGYKAIATQR